MDAKDFNCYIVERDGEFLQAFVPETGVDVWSRYIFDSAPIFRRDYALILARRFYGRYLRFNHATGEYIE